VLAGCYLERASHEMHLSKVLFFASFGVWARDMARPWRHVQLGISVALCLAVLATWYQYRHQHLVPIRPGIYRLTDK